MSQLELGNHLNIENSLLSGMELIEESTSLQLHGNKVGVSLTWRVVCRPFNTSVRFNEQRQRELLDGENAISYCDALRNPSKLFIDTQTFFPPDYLRPCRLACLFTVGWWYLVTLIIMVQPTVVVVYFL